MDSRFGNRPGAATDDSYRLAARVYDRLLEPLFGGLRHLALKVAPPRPGLRVLDVGCGTGTQLAHYQRAGCAVAGVDLSPAMLAAARRKLAPEADLRPPAGDRLPQADGVVDLAICSLVLHELGDPERRALLREIARVLAPGGQLLVIDFHPGPRRIPKGWLYFGLTTVLELFAGWEHFTNGRRFIAAGGIAPLAEAEGFAVARARIVSGGNLALTLLRRA